MSNTTVSTTGSGNARSYSVNGKVIASQQDSRVEPAELVHAAYFRASNPSEAADGAYAVSAAYAAGYAAGKADSVPVNERQARAIADEQIAKALDGLKVEVKR